VIINKSSFFASSRSHLYLFTTTGL